MKNGDLDEKWLWRKVTKMGNDYEEWWLRWDMTMWKVSKMGNDYGKGD